MDAPDDSAALLLETLEILLDADAMSDLRAGHAEIEAGTTVEPHSPPPRG